MATLYLDNGDTLEVTPINPNNGFELEQLYKLLHTNIVEVVRLNDDTILIIDEEGIDEEGKFKGDNAVNTKATELARGVLGPFDYIVGHALHCKTEEFK
jgi:hypothetical protein